MIALSDTPVILDAPDTVARLGMIALSTDLTSEGDAGRLIPRDRAALHVTRVAFQNPTTPENLRLMAPLLTQAAHLLVPGEDLSAVYYACTAASVVIGDDVIAQAIQAARPRVPVVTPSGAAMAAFRTLGARRIAVLTPYLPCTTGPMVDYFTRHGFDIVSAQCLGLEDDRDMARISAKTILDAAVAADHPDAEAVFLSCTAMPALGVIGAVEARLGKPVVSSNQAALWQMLGHAGLSPQAPAAGRLFAVPPAESAA